MLGHIFEAIGGFQYVHDMNHVLEGQGLCGNQDTRHQGVVKYHPACPSTSARLPHLCFYQNPFMELSAFVSLLSSHCRSFCVIFLASFSTETCIRSG